MEIQNLIDVKAELIRFEKRLDEAIVEAKKDPSIFYAGAKVTGAVKRAALDLKNELTKITR